MNTTASIATAAVAAASASATTTTQSAAGADPNGECKLLGPFAILVQGALGALALLALVYKRWRERPQRPVKIWAFDVSKQVFGSVLLHLANLLMSMFSAGDLEAKLAKAAAKAVGTGEGPYKPNPCSFYLLNLGIDTTLGIPILLGILKVLTFAAARTPLARPPESIKSGNYGSPPRATWWLKQSIIYFLGLLGMKFCVFVIFQLAPWIVMVGDWALKWTEGNTALQIAFVMLIFPLIMNAMQYYIIDTFIKKNTTADEPDDLDQHGDAEEEGGLLDGHQERLGPSLNDGDGKHDVQVASQPASNKSDRDRATYMGDSPGGESSTSSSTTVTVPDPRSHERSKYA